MSLIDNAKEIADLVKKMGDIELYRKIVALEGEIIDLTRKVRSLEDENAALQRNLAKQKKVVFTPPFFLDQDAGQSCCPHCWQNDEKLIYVVGPNKIGSISVYTCPTCRRFYREQNGHWAVALQN